MFGLALLVTACAPAEETLPEAAAQPAPTYLVRGRVLEPWNGERLAIRHEAIVDFRGASGELEPMAEMSMRFPVAADLDVESLEVGQLISFELGVDWERRPPHRIESLERLPADTELELSR